jgi:uncharacterized protein (DUF1800 family)
LLFCAFLPLESWLLLHADYLALKMNLLFKELLHRPPCNFYFFLKFNYKFMASINPLQQVLGHRFAKHLLRRATFRYSKQDIDDFAGKTVQAAVNQLFSASTDPIPEPQDPEDAVPFWINHISPSVNVSGDYRKRSYVKGAWLYNALSTLSIRHKMVQFLYNQFTVNADNVSSTWFYDYLGILDFYAWGSVKELALKVTYSNAMLRYLDNRYNHKNGLNENYARELLELFTIGKGPQIGPGNYTTYTETDVVEAAKVLTGLVLENTRTSIDSVTGIPLGEVSLNRHDTNNKTFSSAFQNRVITGATTAQGVETEIVSFLDMIFDQTATAKNICRKLYRFFVHDTITTEVETDIIAPMAAALIQSNYVLEPVVKLLLKSAHFYDMDDANATDELIGGVIKSPLQLLTEVISLFQVDLPDPVSDALDFYKVFNHNFLVRRYFPSAGMPLFAPSTVAGYPAYYQKPLYSKYWFDSSTIIARYKLLDSLLSGRNETGGNRNIIGLQFEVVDFFANSPIFTDRSNPATVVADAVHYLFPESVDSSRLSYFTNDIFLGGLMPYNWSNEWAIYQNTNDDSVIKPRLEVLFTFLLNSPEFQTY